MKSPGVEPCIFCRIIHNEAPASIVFRDNAVTAFLDIQPVNPGHLLVVPNRHAASLADLHEEDGQRMFTGGQRLAAALRQSGIRCEGVDLFLADGEAAGQEVFHVHLHVIPRFAGDGFRFTFGRQYRTRPSREELDGTAAAIGRAIGRP